MNSAPWPNPTGLKGVEFVEFAGTDPAFYAQIFSRFGFEKMGQIKDKQIELYRQNNINFIVNYQPGSFAWEFARQHGPSICSTGFRFANAAQGHREAVGRGGVKFDGQSEVHPFPSIFGIGSSLIYFADGESIRNFYSQNFHVEADQKPLGRGFQVIDHFTNNVPAGEMQKWCDFYTRVFAFRETRYFDIKGAKTGLISKVMRSPCDSFAVPINEPSDSKSQIQEYLDEYRGSGIQHLALLTSDIIQSLEAMKDAHVEFLTPPPTTYYKMLTERLPNIREDISRLQKDAVLADGDSEGYLLQIFTKNSVGPIFFELIQRENHSGFGEGNFQALFDAIERDQQERGYL
ncbi:MAG: 4-hydroxyphenylpyruvate dioxygenase [Bdellovibrio sp.]